MDFISIIRLGNTVIVPSYKALDTIKLMIIEELGKFEQGYDELARKDLRDHVPVRTGKLLDNLLNNLTTEVIGSKVIYNTSPPSGYPSSIINPAHRGEIGWGRKYTPTHNIANVTVLRPTKKGAYYILNDPSAVSDYMGILGTKTLPKLSQRIKQILPSFSMVLTPTTYAKDYMDFLVGEGANVYTGGEVTAIIPIDDIDGADFISAPTPLEIQTRTMGESRDAAMSGYQAQMDAMADKLMALITKRTTTQLLHIDDDVEGIPIGLGLTR